MVTNRFLSAFMASLALVTLVSCAATEGSSDKMASSAATSSTSGDTSKSAHNPEFSGFLSDYSKLKPDPNFKNTLDWLNPDLAHTGYNAIIIDRVATHLDPALIKSGVKPDAQVINQITDYFHQALTREFSQYFTVTDKAGDGVMRYRAAITGVDAERDMGDNPLDFLPVVLVARTATGANSVKTHVFMEAIYTDSVSGQVLAELVQSAAGGAESKEISLDSVRSALDAWAKKAAEGAHTALGKQAMKSS